jgi:hypothetical protein
VTEGRWELKYMIHEREVPGLLDEVGDDAQPDPHAEDIGLGRKGYTVSSVYLDNHGFEGYTERLRMDRIRNRVRIRTYGQPGSDAPVFLEAKRKLDNNVIKHRGYACGNQLWRTLGPRPWQAIPEMVEGIDRVRARRFVDHVDGKRMESVCLVRYEREIFTAGSARLTLDRDVRAAPRPPPTELLAPCPARLFPPDWIVLELKFFGQMPGWMRRVNARMKLRSEPVSKFALGVATTVRPDHPHELAQLMPATLRRLEAA